MEDPVNKEIKAAAPVYVPELGTTLDGLQGFDDAMFLQLDGQVESESANEIESQYEDIDDWYTTKCVSVVFFAY